MMKRIATILAVLLVAASGIGWISASPAPEVKIAYDQYPLRELSEQMRRVRMSDDDIAHSAGVARGELRGYDDVVLQEDLGRAFVTGMDGYIWQVNLQTGQQERMVKTPLIPAGARLDPGNPDMLYFCTSRLYGRTHAADERPGLYRLRISSRQIEAVALGVPKDERAKKERVFAEADAHYVAQAAMTPASSRAIEFCNDLDISADGRRLYFSEPYASPTASMGGGALGEAITRGRNGRVWLVDLDRGVRLVAHGIAFPDGMLLDAAAKGERESSLLVTEATNYRLLRLQFAGAKSGMIEVLQESLPGSPDGLDRDAAGRIWVSLIKERSAVATWLHNHAWTKPLLLRLPRALLPVPHRTGMLALSPDGKTPLYLSIHDGKTVPEISVVTPGKKTLYPAAFDPKMMGFVTMPYPAGLSLE